MPATVVIVLPEILRITLFPVSAMYRLPAESNARPFGELNSAAAGSPLSPAYPALPLPANVWMVYCWPRDAGTQSNPRHTTSEQPRIFMAIYSENAPAGAPVTEISASSRQ